MSGAFQTFVFAIFNVLAFPVMTAKQLDHLFLLTGDHLFLDIGGRQINLQEGRFACRSRRGARPEHLVLELRWRGARRLELRAVDDGIVFRRLGGLIDWERSKRHNGQSLPKTALLTGYRCCTINSKISY